MNVVYGEAMAGRSGFTALPRLREHLLFISAMREETTGSSPGSVGYDYTRLASDG